MSSEEDKSFADKKIKDLSVEELRSVLKSEQQPEVEKETFSTFAKGLKDSTRKTYRTSIRSFMKHVFGKEKIEGIEELDKLSLQYLESVDREQVRNDLSQFLKTLIREGKAGQTVHTYASCVKEWLLRYGLIYEEEWSRLKRKAVTVPNVPEIRGEVLSRDRLRKVINKLDQLGRSLALFLLSAGLRVREALSIEKENLFLGEEPPRAYIEQKHTKGNAPGRTVFFTKEAADEIREWLNLAPNREKKGYQKKEDGIYQFSQKTDWNHVPTHDETDRVWEIDYHTARRRWNRALRKCGLDKKQNGQMVYNLHSLRRFFRSNWTSNEDVRKVLMGQLSGLDRAYLRKPEEELAEEYEKNADKYLLFQGPAGEAYAKAEISALRGSLLAQGIKPEAIQKALRDWGKSTEVARRLRKETPELAMEEFTIDTIRWEEVTEPELKDLRKRLIKLAQNSD